MATVRSRRIAFSSVIFVEVRCQYDNWHYVNWLDQVGSIPRCVPDYILNELPRHIRVLSTSDVHERAMALSWVLHLVGDLHRPLHVADHDDLGGNWFPVSYRGSAFYLRGNKEVALNLHHVWDDNLVDELVYRMDSMNLPAAAVPDAVARALLTGAGILVTLINPRRAERLSPGRQRHTPSHIRLHTMAFVRAMIYKARTSCRRLRLYTINYSTRAFGLQ